MTTRMSGNRQVLAIGFLSLVEARAETLVNARLVVSEEVEGSKVYAIVQAIDEFPEHLCVPLFTFHESTRWVYSRLWHSEVSLEHLWESKEESMKLKVTLASTCKAMSKRRWRCIKSQLVVRFLRGEMGTSRLTFQGHYSDGTNSNKGIVPVATEASTVNLYLHYPRMSWFEFARIMRCKSSYG
ncbi:hypothetical protein Patl1_36897 [Pistacia atlantica]|nr:hypothetical protein Patl1_36897 [Pistacia atlantica]